MKKLLSLILAAVLALCCTACVPSPKRFDLEREGVRLLVHFIDVGQGDSILLESQGEFVLIDTGEKEYAGTVTDYIRSCGADSLKYVIATHPHTDHIGAMAKVLNTVDTENFITVETDQSTRSWLNVLDAVEINDINYIDAVPGESFRFGDATFTIMGPLGDGYEGYNDYSVVTKVRCGDVSFLLTGDAEKQSEYEMVNAGEDLSADVLKCGHHGSSTSSTAKFLKAVDPSYAIISCGKNNDYGHPHRETLKKLAILHCPVLRTDELGTIVALTDGKEIRFKNAGGSIEVPTYSEDGPAYYIGNKSSHVFHLPECSGAESMSEKNQVILTSRDDAVALGYTPCGLCCP